MPIRFDHVADAPGMMPNRVAKNIKGVIQIYTRKDGKVIVRKWMRPRGKKQTPLQKIVSAQWKQSMQWVQTASPSMVAWATATAHATLWNPRDLIMLMHFGKVYEIHMADGSYYGSGRIMASQIQALLNTISDTPGTILVCLDDGWSALLPGDSGDVLTSRGTSAPPEWEPASGGGGSGAVHYGLPIVGPATHTLTANAIVLLPFWCAAGSVIEGVAVQVWTDDPTHPIGVALYAQDGVSPNAPGSLLAASSTPHVGVAYGDVIEVPFATAYEVAADGVFWIGLTTRGGLDVNAGQTWEVHNNTYYDPLPDPCPALTFTSGFGEPLFTPYGTIYLGPHSSP